MENYFSQLLSRSAPDHADLLQPVSAPVSKGAGDDIEWQPFLRPMEDNVTVGQPETPIKAFSPIQTDSATPSITEHKTEYHQYLRQYFTRTVAGNGNPPTNSIMGKAAEAPLANHSLQQPRSIMAPPENLRPPHGQQATAHEANPLQSSAPLLPVDLRITPTATSVAPALLPTTWLLPPAPAPPTAPLQAPASPKPAPSLTIGKILIELVPVKPVPPRTAHRPSPFQMTGNASKPSSSSFGLGQL